MEDLTTTEKEYYGLRFLVREGVRDEYVINEVLNEQSYQLPENPKVVIDIGAHIGTFSLLAARAGAEVYAFEPDKLNYEALCYNVAANDYSMKIHCVNLAVGEPGLTKFYIHPDNSGGNTSYGHVIGGIDKTRYRVVQFISIKKVFSMFDIDECDILKLDCEGSENDIFDDFDDELASKVKQISAEIHNNRLREGFIQKLSKWYDAELTHKKNKTWVFKRKI